jgi:2,3-bisphosphoglycerate-independent phosphoglycerate mutase
MDITAKVRGIEEFDRELVGPLLDGLAKHGRYRFLVLCDHGEGVTGQAFYAFGEGGGKGTGGKRFTEADAQASTAPPRDATKFAARFLAKS